MQVQHWRGFSNQRLRSAGPLIPLFSAFDMIGAVLVSKLIFKLPRFAIVSQIDTTAVDNALAGVTKEMDVRYDFKGSHCKVSRTEEAILITADDELKRRQVEELIITHLTRNGVDTKALEFEKPEPAGGNSISQTVHVRQGVHREVAQKIVKAIKGAKLKTQAAIQGEEIRVSGKKRDELQATMTMIKALDIDLPLQYENVRD